MNRLRARLATVSTTTAGLLLTAGPALAAKGTKPVPGEHDTLIGGEAGGLVFTAVGGLVLGVVTYAMLPKAPETHDEHH